MRWHPEWPILKRYEGKNLRRIAMPLGGLGTGTVSLSGVGALVDWEVGNRPAKGFVPRMSYNGRAPGPSFVLYAKEAGKEAVCRLLEGPLDTVYYEGAAGATVANQGLPRFRSCEFGTAYPLSQVALSDKDVPVRVRLEAFNPLIPGDAERSGLPVAVLRYVVDNPGKRKVTVSVCGSVPNLVGVRGAEETLDWSGKRYPNKADRNVNIERSDSRLQGVLMRSDGVAAEHPAWGTLALTTTAKRGVSCRTAWAERSWGDSLLDFWDDFSDDGVVEEREQGAVDSPMGSLAVRFSLAPGQSREVVFILAWHFPNRQSWTADAEADDNCIGNYYTCQYADAWEAASSAARQLKTLERDTVRFVREFCGSDLPRVVKEAALFNLSTLRSQTCFRTPDGNFYGFEGCHDVMGCCHGNCTHVWNYEQATAFLFGDLARTMRVVEYGHCVDEVGLMSFRVSLPLSRGRQNGLAAADGQLGCVMKLYREWQLSGDDGFLRDLWPAAKRSLAFCWVKGGWDADQDGVMEGCQHNTMDVEYFGPNPQMQGWYLGALRAAEEMARYLGEEDFAGTCAGLFEAGKAYMDEVLFNGSYYEHHIQPAASMDDIYPGLKIGSGSKDVTKPELQLGSGCLVDQLVGQYMAHVCGLGYLHDPRHVRKTLRSIMSCNFKESMTDHFNHLRGYALGDESALLMASYPREGRPKRPFPYFNEVMTGFEYTAGAHMLYEGQVKKGLKVFSAIRERYDGHRRNPFDEAECGHHYARAMASWAGVLALSNFQYSAVRQTMSFAAEPGRWFWSNGAAWGRCRVKQTKKGTVLKLQVVYGQVCLRSLGVTGGGVETYDEVECVRAGESLTATIHG